MKLKILCGQCKKEIFYINFTNFKNKKQCNECSNNNCIKVNKRIVKPKLTLEQAYEISYKYDLTPLYKEYRNANEKLLHETKEGYKILCSISTLNQGNSPTIFGKCNPYTIENIKLWLKINNIPIKIISNVFESACKHKLTCKCEKGHIYKISWNNLQNHNSKCPICSKENNKGENHYNYKGGITVLHEHLRNTSILQWKKDSMKNCNYKCVVTGKKFNVVHHLHGFDQILQETMEILDLTIHKEINKYKTNELKLIEDTCLKLHYKYGLGICLCDEIHKLFHSKELYGIGKNTPEQFEEFKQRYFNGEFDN